MLDPTKVKRVKRHRRKRHIHKKVYGTDARPRLVIYRSLKHIYAQIVNDTAHRTILSVSTLNKDIADELQNTKGKIEKAKIVGKKLSEVAKANNISRVVFDRSGYLFHGRVKALAEAVREGGLEF